ncbi:MAG: monooxygenase [Polyangiales bacterium]
MKRSFVFAMALAGCGGLSNSAKPGDAGPDVAIEDLPSDLPCDVQGVIARNCQSCHTSPPAYGAPMPLVTRDDVASYIPSIKDRIHRAADAVGRMPQKPTPPLSSDDLATLDTWMDSGAPKGFCKPGGAPNPKPQALTCKPNVSMHSASPFTMPKAERDLYACYGFDLEAGQKLHITGVAPRIQNSKIVHHVLLMQSDHTVSSTPYHCGAGIGQWRMLYAWAPGVGSFELPKEAGLPAETGKTHFVVQTHYNNIQGLEGETDDSGFDVCTTEDLRPNDADILAFGSMRFTIPAHKKLDLSATYLVPASMGTIHAVGAFPHMHQLGKSIVTTVMPGGDGAPIDLGTDHAFDFGSQFFTPLSDVVINPGDVVKTRCVWENTTDNDVSFGENTEDEMCFSFTLYYPKVKADPWIWSLPSFAASMEEN